MEADWAGHCFQLGLRLLLGKKERERQRTERDGVESRELRREPLAISQTIYVALYKRGRRRERERREREEKAELAHSRSLVSVIKLSVE